MFQISISQIFILLVGSVLTFFTSAQSWEQVENFPGNARDDGSNFAIGTNHYFGLGKDLGFNCMRDFYMYNSMNSSWSTITPMPLGEERQYATGTSWNGLGIIFGGLKCDGSFSNDLWFFDPVSSSWTERTSLPGAGRAGSVHFVLQDTLYIIGGKNSNGILTDVWAYDLMNDNWVPKTSYPGDGIWRGIAFQWNGIGYAGLGKNNLNNQTGFNTDVYSFDPQNQTWALTPLTGLTPRCYVGTAQKDSLVLLFGGLDQSNTILNTFDRLDISDFTLHSLPAFPVEPRKGTMCFLIEDIFYTTTGVSQTQRFNETWRLSEVLSNSELSTEQRFEFYPNPCNEQCTILFGQNLDLDLVIESLDSRFIKRYSPTGDNSMQIEVNEYTPGIYIIRYGNSVSRIEIMH